MGAKMERQEDDLPIPTWTVVGHLECGGIITARSKEEAEALADEDNRRRTDGKTARVIPGPMMRPSEIDELPEWSG